MHRLVGEADVYREWRETPRAPSKALEGCLAQPWSQGRLLSGVVNKSYIKGCRGVGLAKRWGRSFEDRRNIMCKGLVVHGWG